MSTEALARVQKLVERMLGDLHVHGWIVAPDWLTGEPRQEAVPDSYIAEGVMHAILADPAPLLAALAEAGVLREEWGIPDGLAGLQKRTFHSQGMAEALSPDRPVTRRYVTEWTETP